MTARQGSRWSKLRSGKLRRYFVAEFFEGVLAAVVIAVVLRLFVIAVYRVPTDSMRPALVPGDIVIGLRTAYGIPIPFGAGERWSRTEPDRGDIVVFRGRGIAGPESELLYVKRVVGVAGDRIEIRDGRLVVNDVTISVPTSSEFPELEAFEESFDRPPYKVLSQKRLAAAPGFYGPVVVPPDHVFLLGDYRSESADSRHWGPVSVRDLEAKVAVVVISLDLAQESGRRVRWDRFFSSVP